MSDHDVMTPDVPSAHGSGPWVCQLICCGYDDGIVRCASWEDADRMREDYTSGAGVHPNGYSAPAYEGGHRRAVIVSLAEGGGQ